jgi:hypothetical protein
MTTETKTNRELLEESINSSPRINLTGATENLRLGILKRVDVELANLLENAGLDGDWQTILEDLRGQVLQAIGTG